MMLIGDLIMGAVLLGVIVLSAYWFITSVKFLRERSKDCHH